jgi:hypothetical protein
VAEEVRYGAFRRQARSYRRARNGRDGCGLRTSNAGGRNDSRCPSCGLALPATRLSSSRKRLQRNRRTAPGRRAELVSDSAVAAGFSGDSLLRADADFATLPQNARFQHIVATAERAFRPCLTRPESHLFDFWIGEWDVTTPQGQPAGKSSVQQILSQCVIFENWTDGQNGQGKSFNAYNAELGMWQQFWTDQYGRVTEYRQSEKTVDGGLRFTARTRMPRGPALVRMTFTPVDRNTVRQLGETSFDAVNSWQTSYDLYYHRRAP